MWMVGKLVFEPLSAVFQSAHSRETGSEAKKPETKSGTESRNVSYPKWKL